MAETHAGRSRFALASYGNAVWSQMARDTQWRTLYDAHPKKREHPGTNITNVLVKRRFLNTVFDWQLEKQPELLGEDGIAILEMSHRAKCNCQ